MNQARENEEESYESRGGSGSVFGYRVCLKKFPSTCYYRQEQPMEEINMSDLLSFMAL